MLDIHITFKNLLFLLLLALGIILFAVKISPKIPVYPQANLISSVEEKSDGYTKQVDIWGTINPVPQVAAWYLKALPDSGWTIDTPPANINDEGVQFTVARRGYLTLNLSLVRQNHPSFTEITLEVPFPQGTGNFEE